MSAIRRRSLRGPLLACVAAAVALAGCGGGDSPTDAAIDQPPTPAVSISAEPTPTAPTAAARTVGLIYTTPTGLWSAGLDGSAPRRLDKHTEFDGLAVSPDGRTIAFSPKEAGLYLVGIDGSGKRLIDKDALGDPAFSPNGRIIVTIGADGPGLNVFAINVDGSDRHRLSDNRQYIVQIHPSGKYVAVAGPKSQDLFKGAAVDTVPIAGGSSTRVFSTPGGIHNLSWSPQGHRLAYVLEAEISLDIKTDLYVMDADGKKSRRLTKTQDVGLAGPAWSPDGKTLVFSRAYGDVTSGKNLGIWAVNADGSKLRRIATTGSRPRYSPDGRHIVFSDGNGLRVIRPDGSGATTVGKGEVGDFAFAAATTG